MQSGIGKDLGGEACLANRKCKSVLIQLWGAVHEDLFHSAHSR
jgi:hypothetical protein